MNKVVIVSDSTCDLSPELVKEYGIKIIPLTVAFGEELYHDGVDITTEQLYQKVSEKNELPHTAALTPGQLLAFFEEIIEEGNDILFAGIGSSLSKSYENACMIASEFPEGRIEIVDSKNLSTGTGLLIIKACMLRDTGKNIHEIAEELRKIVPNVRSQFIVDTMEYLHKGGRCSGVAKLFGTLLKIHPLIAVKEGVLKVAGKPRGKMTVGLNQMLDMLKAEGNNVDEDIIFVTHSIAPESAKYLLPLVKEAYPNARVVETNAGAIISSHCGKGTIGIIYALKH